ncbi:methyltransferase domain-containing protein [Streptomyces sp. NPDC028635]|uniref:methyltransferase domain-containing protein n=1 Tax=Streptomyces sp. NPDC028635 TaxID=3154800 RepID=UPI0033DA3676
MSPAPGARVLVLEHAPQEGPSAVATALEAAGLKLRVCRPWAGDAVPATLADTVALVLMGARRPTRDEACDDLPGRSAELALLRAALEAEVPVLAVGRGAQLLAAAAGGTARCGDDFGADWGGIHLYPAADTDPLFSALPPRLRVPHRPADTTDLPTGATVLASCDGRRVQAFRIGGTAWGLRFHLEAGKRAADAVAAAFAGHPATARGPVESARPELAIPAPHRDQVLARFASLVTERAPGTATRTFFTPRAATWEERFAADNPVYAAAVARMGLRPGQRALDVGCGSGRALPALRAQVGEKGVVVGLDLTPAMLTATAREGRAGLAGLLLADACRLPLSAGAVDAVFSAGLVNHVPDADAALREWARVTAPGGVLLLFHPSGRAERAARHGCPLDPDDPLAEENLRPALETAGWKLACYEDAARHFLARAVRSGG